MVTLKIRLNTGGLMFPLESKLNCKLSLMAGLTKRIIVVMLHNGCVSTCTSIFSVSIDRNN